MRRLIYIISSALLFFSCEKYIDMEIPDRGRKLVANCFYSDTGTVAVYLTQSRFILDNSEFINISGATVIFYENGIAEDTLTETEPGKYLMYDFIPSTGKNQSVKIIKGNDIITAQSYIPEKVPIEFIDTIRIKTESNEFLRFRFRVNDPSDIDNYYMIGFEMEKSGEDPYNQPYLIYFSTEEPFVESYNDNFGLISDILFRGQSQVMSFDIELYNFYNDPNKMYIHFFSISKDRFLYLATLQAQIEAGDSPFSEPVMIYNNIENGFGIFAGFSIYRDSVTIPKLSDNGGWIE